VASPDCFRSLTAVWLADILGMDVTPALSGLEQSPLVAIHLHQAPKSHRFFPLLGVASGQPVVARFCDDFHRLPSRLSHLAVPAVDLSHSLAFDSLSSCEVDDVLRYARYP